MYLMSDGQMTIVNRIEASTEQAEAHETMLNVEWLMCNVRVFSADLDAVHSALNINH
jgi:hypothetical protein